VFASDANEKLFGRPAQAAIGTNGVEFINPDDLAMFAAMFEAYARGYTSDAPNYYRVRHEDGTWIRMEIAGGPIHRDGEIIGWSFVLRRPLQAEVYAAVVRHLFEQAPLAEALAPVPNAFFALGIGQVCFNLWPAGETPFRLGDELPDLLDGTDRPAGSPFERAVLSGEDVVVHDLTALASTPAVAEAAAAARFGSLYVAPVLEIDRVAGLLVHWVYDDMPKADMLAARMQEAKGLVQVALSTRLQHDDLVRSASSDPLTGLANRRTFDAALDALLPGDRPVLLSLDLDGFKAVNDERGHLVGDEILRIVARRLEHVARRSDLVARIGGDEFVVLLRDASAEEAQELGRRVVESISRPIEIEGRLVHVGVSVGVATLDMPSMAESTWTATLQRDADDAMYEAKRTGRGRVVVAGR